MKISIITVCYNGATTLEQTIKSVIAQQYEDVEYIIIDGGSTDGTIDIIENYEEYISYWISEPDNGIYDAMNKGLKQAKGEVVAFLNSDDWYENGTLAKVCHYFQENNLDILCGAVNGVFNDRKYASFIKDFSAEDIHTSMIYAHPAIFAQRAVFEEIGIFNTKYKICADYEWCLRAHNAGKAFLRVPDIFTNFRYGGMSTFRIAPGRMEGKEISLANMGEHESKSFRSYIQKKFDERIEAAERDDQFQDILKNHKELICECLGESEEYYIWGTGLIGDQCYELFNNLGIKVRAFVDTHKKQDVFRGISVILPSDMNECNFICIASYVYEGEIIKQLEDMGINQDRYITFSELKKRVIEMERIRFGR